MTKLPMKYVILQASGPAYVQSLTFLSSIYRARAVLGAVKAKQTKHPNRGHLVLLSSLLFLYFTSRLRFLRYLGHPPQILNRSCQR